MDGFFWFESGKSLNDKIDDAENLLDKLHLKYEECYAKYELANDEEAKIYENLLNDIQEKLKMLIQNQIIN